MREYSFLIFIIYYFIIKIIIKFLLRFIFNQSNTSIIIIVTAYWGRPLSHLLESSIFHLFNYTMRFTLRSIHKLRLEYLYFIFFIKICFKFYFFNNHRHDPSWLFSRFLFIKHSHLNFFFKKYQREKGLNVLFLFYFLLLWFHVIVLLKISFGSLYFNLIIFKSCIPVINPTFYLDFHIILCYLMWTWWFDKEILCVGLSLAGLAIR